MVIVPTRFKIGAVRLVAGLIHITRRLFGRDDVAHVKRGAINWVLDLSESIDFAIYTFNLFERSTVQAYRRLLSPGMTAIDIGANMGFHTLSMAKAIKGSGRIVAIEPTSRQFQRLTNNVACNPDLSSCISRHQTMLSHEEDATLPAGIFASWPTRTPEGDSHAVHLGVASSTTGAEVHTLDHLVESLGLERIDLIKMDVDGYEMDVLRGAMQTLKAYRPTIVMELAPYTWQEHGFAADAPTALLSEVGYIFTDLDGQDIPDIRRRVLDMPSGSSINIIARYRSSLATA